MNPLVEVAPALWRRRLYLAYALVGLVVGGLQVGYATTGGDPEWLQVVLALVAYLGVALGLTAASNTQPNAPSPEET